MILLKLRQFPQVKLLAHLLRLSIFLSFPLCFSQDDFFPDMIASDDIAYFSKSYDLDGLHWALSNIFARSERVAQGINLLPELMVSRGGGSHYTTEYKLKLDLEQAEYLVEEVFSDEKDPELYRLFKSKVIPTLRAVLSHIPPLIEMNRTEGMYAFGARDFEAEIQHVYNKALYNPDPEYDASVPLLNPNLPVNKIQNEWENEEHPGIVVIDDILSPETLQVVRRIMLENTVWYQTKIPKRFGGYVGAYIDDGLHQKILLDLSNQLHRALPKIMQQHPLKYMWAYKYDSNFKGIQTHADSAAVNVNLWITPDEANLDPNSGGLVIFTAKPPAAWDFASYNADPERVDREILRPTNYANITVPYRANRAVIFDSALFHHSDRFDFKRGYKNRRINLTLLYGDMQLNPATSCGSEASCAIKEKQVKDG